MYFDTDSEQHMLSINVLLKKEKIPEEPSKPTQLLLRIQETNGKQV